MSRTVYPLTLVHEITDYIEECDAIGIIAFEAPVSGDRIATFKHNYQYA